LLPLPACGERVGVRGTLRERVCGEFPSPVALRAPTSPRKRGEVTRTSAPIPLKVIMP
jgi:hypothetical protein